MLTYRSFVSYILHINHLTLLLFGYDFDLVAPSVDVGCCASNYYMRYAKFATERTASRHWPAVFRQNFSHISICSRKYVTIIAFGWMAVACVDTAGGLRVPTRLQVLHSCWPTAAGQVTLAQKNTPDKSFSSILFALPLLFLHHQHMLL